ncbi:DNA-3-methyladenine glycosylase 2 family protein [Hydrogenophaga sp.]|uniref:DNA-3-methyladenine glycosylase 2 family protein n=1 Tax=Hydrogenophaga sp. TaxID=1904254 RepID=UPI00272041BD|nr:Ada metal-binding domain-containing protein [Hydrogenophaga sp.]MDO8903947.1 Ada metal-binding domain-containing protein [Hydrogenophaga sp.]
MSAPSPTQDVTRYRALCSKDARFDGGFFVGVTSTGIYCRPVCRVRTPRLENCRFFDLAAQAEKAGFRPCLRCRPELAPRHRHWTTTDATLILAQQATLLLDDPGTWLDLAAERTRIAAVATRLGVSDRHLRRVFEMHLGVSPHQYLQTCRLLAAKQLLTDTRLPVSDVALASGFASLRRFNAAFVAHYRINPTQMRRDPATSIAPVDGTQSVRLAWRPPLDASHMMKFFEDRQLDGIESFQTSPESSFKRTVRLTVAGRTHVGWIAGKWEVDTHLLLLEVSDGLQKALPSVIRRVRTLFDLDADPAPINAVLQRDFPSGNGLRVPGCFDGFELAVRAVLGQQVTVGAARTLAARVVQQWGDPIATPDPAINRLFPTAQALAQADENVLGTLGIVRQRQLALKSLAQAVLAGQVDLNPSSTTPDTLQVLQSLPGIGPWTAQYIAMRALRWPDAWPEGDVALVKALGLEKPRNQAARHAAERLAERWQPWRSYAVIRAWAGTYHPSHATSNV